MGKHLIDLYALHEEACAFDHFLSRFKEKLKKGYWQRYYTDNTQ